MKAKEIDALPPGSVLRIPLLAAPFNTYEWVRMQDAPSMQFTGGLFCPVTGEWTGWQSLCWMEDEVELVKQGETDVE
jgi:hypothetical protein